MLFTISNFTFTIPYTLLKGQKPVYADFTKTFPIITYSHIQISWLRPCIHLHIIFKNAIQSHSWFSKVLFVNVDQLHLRCFSVINVFFFSIWVFFHEHSRFTGQQGKGEGIYLTPLYHFHPLHGHLDISRAITAGSSPLPIAGSRTWTGNLWFPRTSR